VTNVLVLVLFLLEASRKWKQWDVLSQRTSSGIHQQVQVSSDGEDTKDGVGGVRGRADYCGGVNIFQKRQCRS